MAAPRATHPGSAIAVVDNILDMRYFADFMPELAGAPARSASSTRPSRTSARTQLRLLRDAGVRTIQPGIESFSDPSSG